MKIQVISDIHLEFGPLDNPQAPDADVVVLAGDVWLGTKAVDWILDNFTIPVVYICGNHEFYHNTMSTVIKKLYELTKDTNIHFLDRNSVVIDGVRFLGSTLWTDFNLYNTCDNSKLLAGMYMSDYRCIRYDESCSFTPSKACDEHVLTKEWLKKELLDTTHLTVVVTHHGPTAKSIPVGYRDDEMNPAYVSDLSPLIQENEIALWIHGHTHLSLEYELYGTRVICNPRGYYAYETNPDFDVHKIVEI